MANKCVHYYVSGRVQGVWFRAHTQKQAQGLGLTGWVRNLPDGRVELVASGDEKHLQKLEEWLWLGPELAKVDLVEKAEMALENFADFALRK